MIAAALCILASRHIRQLNGRRSNLLTLFRWASAPRYLLRDRDGSYGEPFPQTAQAMQIREVLTAPRSPWQNAYVERLIGSIRRDCLDHVLVFNECNLRRILKSYFDY